MNTTLGKLKAGDEILSIGNVPASNVPVWGGNGSLVVAWTRAHRNTNGVDLAIIGFEGGGKIPPERAECPCVIA